ncbi:HAD family hydrolase [Streptomyces sp. 4N509B]|uniref:HAD family hydrolase n=1 Tax=Streptomyces sp. 4N509B TaxID=3457413 RepID=UPI003FCF6474
MATTTKGVIFDVDGTLADTPQAIATITAKVLASAGHSVDEDAIRATVGQPLPKVLAGFMGLEPHDARVLAAAEDYGKQFGAYVKASGPNLLYPGVAEGLSKLAAAGYKLALATSKVEKAANALAKLTGIDGLLTAVAGDDSVERGKPNPDMALHVAKQLGLTPAECVVVGDGLPDAGMGTAAGMTVIGVSYGVASAAELTKAGAATVVDSFPEVVATVMEGALVGGGQR